MFMRFDEVEGFTFEEVLLAFAVVLMAHALAEILGRGFDRFPRAMGNGEFDRALVRPRSIILQILMSQIDFTRIGRLIQAILVLIYAIPASSIAWSPNKIFILTLMIISGTIIFFALFMLRAALAFFTIEGLEFMNILTYGGREFGRYPFSIYGDNILRFLTFIIPLALFQYYPLLYLLGRTTNPLNAAAPLLGATFILPTHALFRRALKSYKSTGS